MAARLRPKTNLTLPIAGAVAVLAATIGLLFHFYPRGTGRWSQVTIATATTGGTYYLLGGQLARILERLPGEPIDGVQAVQSHGSRENVRLLIDSAANVALVMRPALVEAVRENPAVAQGLRVLARLYTDVVQIVVRKDAAIAAVSDLRRKRIYVGTAGSGTRMLAARILAAIGLSEGDYAPDDAASHNEAADRLNDGTLDAAFFASGTPTEAVQRALGSGEVELLSLDRATRERLTEGDGELGLSEAEIPTNHYHNQPDAVQTVGADVLLACRTDLPEDLAFVILEALFDNIGDLQLAHPNAQDIKLTRAFDLSDELLHRGAKEFREHQRSALLIATGAINGKYYGIGKTIRSLLQERGIAARVMQTDGSLENAELLSTRPTIAIMQYDAALASRFGEPRFVYRVDLPDWTGLPQVRNIRRIAVLHEEQVHVIIRREKLASVEALLREKHSGSAGTVTTLTELADAQRQLSPSQARLRMSLGPRRSAARIVAQAILEHHRIDMSSITPSFLSVPDMVNRLHTGEIDGAFFVSYVPGEAMKTILNDGKIRLLSLGQKERAPMTATVFASSRIDPGTYLSQKEGEPAIQTLATQAVLVTTEDLPFDVAQITEAIFDGEAFLGVVDRESMARDLPSLPLHPDAKRYYREAGYLPSKPPVDWLTPTWRSLAILVILISGYKGLIKFRRDGTANAIGRRVLAVPLEAGVPDSNERLKEIRDEIQRRVRRRWWRPGELDKPRWRSLRDLIDDRIREAKINMTTALLEKIRAVRVDAQLDEVMRREQYQAVERQIHEQFEHDELDSLQHDMLRELVHEHLQQDE
jgi:TRAP transporter TAXI family solute receptor